MKDKQIEKLIQEELERTFNEEVDVEILADLLEIKDLKWKEAM